ncbi:MAG: hypothetical protein JXA04_02105 [Gammaproteobacteria bacterium]|nr:hypothetical protein [Gammaproteobacteria bacterium]
MNDNEILEQRAFLRNLIDKKDREWDEYRKNYAGAPEYWEVQKNAFNEIQALRNQLANLPSTSSERRKRLFKWSAITLPAGFILACFISPAVRSWIYSIAVSSLLSHIALWLITLSILTVLYGIYRYYTYYIDTSFSLMFAVEIEIEDLYTYIFYSIVFAPLVVAVFLVPELSVWSLSAWWSWLLISLAATVSILVFYLVAGCKFGIVLPSDIELVAFIPAVTFPFYILFKLLYVWMI